jgi:hypothetical protein
MGENYSDTAYNPDRALQPALLWRWFVWHMALFNSPFVALEAYLLLDQPGSDSGEWIIIMGAWAYLFAPVTLAGFAITLLLCLNISVARHLAVLLVWAAVIGSMVLGLVLPPLFLFSLALALVSLGFSLAVYNFPFAARVFATWKGLEPSNGENQSQNTVTSNASQEDLLYRSGAKRPWWASTPATLATCTLAALLGVLVVPGPLVLAKLGLFAK